MIPQDSADDAVDGWIERFVSQLTFLLKCLVFLACVVFIVILAEIFL